MELRHIRYLLALVGTGNFTRAASRVGIAQSPFSSQIRDLEREVGARLFHRIPQGAELTAAGKAFDRIVAEIPGQVDLAIRTARRAARGESGVLALGFTASAAFNPVVTQAIRAFRQAWPEVELRLEEANSTRLLAGLAEGRLDAVFHRPGAAAPEGLASRVLSEEPLLVALPAMHPAAASETVELSTLADDPVLTFPREEGPTLYDAIIGAFGSAGITPRLGQTAPQLSSLVNLVAAGLGVTLVPASLAQLVVAGVCFRPIARPETSAQIALATRRGDTSPIVRNFLARAVA